MKTAPKPYISVLSLRDVHQASIFASDSDYSGIMYLGEFTCFESPDAI